MKLALDEMYSPEIARQLRARGRDAISACERDELRAASDARLFERMQEEGRTIVTNNVKDFAPLAARATESGTTHHGLVFTSDKALPRRKSMIGDYVRLLDELMAAHPADGALADQLLWL